MVGISYLIRMWCDLGGKKALHDAKHMHTSLHNPRVSWQADGPQETVPWMGSMDDTDKGGGGEIRGVSGSQWVGGGVCGKIMGVCARTVYGCRQRRGRINQVDWNKRALVNTVVGVLRFLDIIIGPKKMSGFAGLEHPAPDAHQRCFVYRCGEGKN